MGPYREPGPARRGLRRDPRQGATTGRARMPRGRRPRGVRPRVLLPRHQVPRAVRGGYPLFTAAGAADPKLAVQYAGVGVRHGGPRCTGRATTRCASKGRWSRSIPSSRSSLGARLADGPRGEIAYRARPGSRSGRPGRCRTRSTTTCGGDPRREARSRTWRSAHDDVFQLVTRPELAPDRSEDVTVEFESGRRWRSTASALSSWRCWSAPGR